MSVEHNMMARTWTAPSGEDYFYANKNEIEYLYSEIFIDRTYMQPDWPTLPASPTIFDVGANIGLFSRFAAQEWPDASIFAFEPVPMLFDLLRANTEHTPRVEAINVGLGAREESATMLFYPRYTMMSGIRADPARDRATVVSYIERTAAKIDNPILRAAVAKSASSMLVNRFEALPLTVKMSTIEQFARERRLTSVDFLKVDVEGAELDVLTGIGAAWPIVANLVVEVDDENGRLAATVGLLRAHDFSIRVWQAPDYRGTPLYLIAAAHHEPPKGDATGSS
jgi:31-O-methyltransferase